MSTWHAGHPDERAPLPTAYRRVAAARADHRPRAVAAPRPWQLRLAEPAGLLLLLGAIVIVLSMACAPLVGSAPVLVIGLVAGSVALAVGWEALTRKQ